MKKLLLFSIIALSTKLFASPGDTTWVQANIVNLDNYNNFDVRVKFPNGTTTYRQILEIFTMGEYNCPSGSQYCHQWDYTVTNYVMTKSGDTAELSRFISPYANTGVPRFPSNWTQPYIFDVTDYYPILKDSATIRLNYSGYSGGFTANVKFAFIEGTPPRNVLGVQHLWWKYYTYGNAADPISNHVQPYSLSVPANTVTSELKLTITGHGADATDNCCEFSNSGNWHSYSVLLNNNTIGSKMIYRGDCGLNELYPQGGTWIYNRANWCPGALVHINTHALPSANTGSPLGLIFSNYTGSGGYGGFNVNGEVIYYGNFNHAVDADLTDIISPNNDPNYFRENPSSSAPMVRVRNTGNSTINSITFKYGVKDSASSQYTWNGSLTSLHDTAISLPALSSLTNLSLGAKGGTYQFDISILTVNGIADEDATNNALHSLFIVAPTWPNKFVINMKTNNEGVTGLGANPSETSWQITDMNNKVLASRTNANVSTNYLDTLWLASSGVYKLTINDGGCDGLHWWVYDQNTKLGVTAGYLIIKKIGPIPNIIYMNGYSYSGTFHDDFGCGFTQYFSTKGSPTGVYSVNSNNERPALEVYPNPAQENAIITINGIKQVNGEIQLSDLQGRVVLSQKAFDKQNQIMLNHLPAGIYIITYKDEQITQIQTRIAVVK